MLKHLPRWKKLKGISNSCKTCQTSTAAATGGFTKYFVVFWKSVVWGVVFVDIWRLIAVLITKCLFCNLFAKQGLMLYNELWYLE